MQMKLIFINNLHLPIHFSESIKILSKTQKVPNVERVTFLTKYMEISLVFSGKPSV